MDSSARSHLGLLLFLAILLTAFFLGTTPYLVTDAAPAGLLSWPLAGDAEAATGMAASWDAGDRVLAAFSLGLDYLYLIAYATLIAAGCGWAARVWGQRHLRLARLGAHLASGIWLAAAADAIENTVLFVFLIGSVRDPWPAVVFWCAVLKTVLFYVGLLYIAGAGLAAFLRRSGRAGA